MFSTLIDKYLRGTATEAERELVELYYSKMDTRMQTELSEYQENELKERMLSKIRSGMNPGAKVIYINRRNWRRIAAAAVVLILVSVGGYILLKPEPNEEIAKTETQEKRFKNDVAPPTNTKATITLAGGRIVALDSVANGTLAMQGNVHVMKTADGKIIYNGTAKELVYNTLTNPRGSMVIDMTLADGSRVWLNAGSSVTYPVAFIGTERKLEMTGEGYFEVTKNANMPFHVSVNGMHVEVLGTHFNINSYSDEATINTSLLEGSVRVVKGNNLQMLVPGQQAQLNKNDEITLIKNADLDQVMAWKNGFFSFNKADLQTVLRQIARWYDVDISYEGKIPERIFGGKITRNSKASEVLKILEESNVHFKIEGKRIVVMP